MWDQERKLGRPPGGDTSTCRHPHHPERQTIHPQRTSNFRQVGWGIILEASRNDWATGSGVRELIPMREDGKAPL